VFRWFSCLYCLIWMYEQKESIFKIKNSNGFKIGHKPWHTSRYTCMKYLLSHIIRTLSENIKFICMWNRTEIFAWVSRFYLLFKVVKIHFMIFHQCTYIVYIETRTIFSFSTTLFVFFQLSKFRENIEQFYRDFFLIICSNSRIWTVLGRMTSFACETGQKYSPWFSRFYLLFKVVKIHFIIFQQCTYIVNRDYILGIVLI
jgi:hypothetical protein